MQSQVLVRQHEASSNHASIQTDMFSRRARNDLEIELLLLEALECPICNRRIRDMCPDTEEPTETQCQDGHFLCQDCLTNMKFAGASMQCPQCRVPLSRTVRNIFADMWLTLFYEDRKIPWKYAEFGCKANDDITKNEAVKTVTRRLRTTLLDKGSSQPTSEMFRQFRGRDPSHEALLMSLGMQSTTSPKMKGLSDATA